MVFGMTEAVRSPVQLLVYNLDESKNLSMLYIRHLIHQLGLTSGRSWSTTSTSKVAFSERRMRMFLTVYKCQWMSSPSTLVPNTIKSVGGLEMRLGPCTIQVQGYNTGALEHMNTASTLSVACYKHQQLTFQC